MASISHALQSARYNEAVIITINDELAGGDKREMILVACLDEENGGITWRDVAMSPSSNNNISIVRHLRTKRWVLPMLNDKRRNELYDAAILAACKEAASRLNKHTMESSSVFQLLDIGAGTGLLGMLAATHSVAALNDQSPGGPRANIKVTSIEMASAMARLARMNIAANNLQHSPIQVIEGHSCETVLERKAHVCVSELLESGLLGEGLLPALRDAWQRHLDPNAVMVPKGARVYAQVLEGQYAIGNYRGPTVRAGSMRLSVSSNDDEVLLGGNELSGEAILVPVHSEAFIETSPTGINGANKWSVRALTLPIKVLEFDFSSKDLIPGPKGRKCTTSILPAASGIAHGVLFWWELDLWDDITYSTQQGKEPWQDHWQQCLFVFPMSHEECPKIIQGEAFDLLTSHTDFRISFSIQVEEDRHGAESELPKQSVSASDPAPLSHSISPERAMQLNDERRTALLEEAISTALHIRGKDSPVLDLSDFSLCAIMAALAGATKVTSVESSSGGLPPLAAKVAQIGNRLPRSDGGTQHMFQILQSHAEDVSVELMGGFPPSIVMAEPYYELLEGWHLQEALNYYYTVKALKERGTIARTALSVPSYAAVMGCAIQFDSFAEAYGPCGDEKGSSKVRGFCHDIVNMFGDRYHSFDASLNMWQYNYTRLTNSIELARISYEGSCSIENNGEDVSTPFLVAGTCHAMMIWVDFGLRTGRDERNLNDYECQLLSTNSRSHRQLVRKLQEAVTITKEDVGNAVFSCKTTLGGLVREEDHDFELRVIKK